MISSHENPTPRRGSLDSPESSITGSSRSLTRAVEPRRRPRLRRAPPRRGLGESHPGGRPLAATIG